MGMINLGGADFINAEEESFEGFREPVVGGLVLEIVNVEQVEYFKDKTKDAIEISFDIAEGSHKGFYAELQEKFGANLPEGMTKFQTKQFTLDLEGFGKLKAFLNKVGKDPENAASGKGPGIVASVAAAAIDDSLIKGAFIGAYFHWYKNGKGYYNEGVKYFMSVADARKKGIEDTPKPQREVSKEEDSDDDWS